MDKYAGLSGMVKEVKRRYERELIIEILGIDGMEEAIIEELKLRGWKIFETE